MCLRQSLTTSHRSDMTTPDQIIESAKLAIDTYFHGEMKTKRKFSKDMEGLRALLRDYESKQETVRLTNAKRTDGH